MQACYFIAKVMAYKNVVCLLITQLLGNARNILTVIPQWLQMKIIHN